MTIVLPALAVAFAAFCVWQGFRTINRREWWAFHLAAALFGIGVSLALLAVTIISQEYFPNIRE
jgi:hypothetical protein